MNVKEVTQKVAEARKLSKPRNFTQTFDLVFNLQQLDLKRPDHKVDVGVTLSTPIRAKKLKICAVVDHSISEAETVFDHVLYSDELSAIKGDMAKIRSITHGFDRFVVQANHMPLFAQIFGRYLGPMNKMPSPKLGMVITAKTPLQPLYDKLQKTVHLATKKNLVLQVSIGSEKESDEQIAKNIIAVYDALEHALPNHAHNVKNIGVKLTMGKLVVL
jgi:large subunit ribosomal protein L1